MRFLLKFSKWGFVTLSLLFILCWWIVPHFFSVPTPKDSFPEQSNIIFDRNGKQLHHATRDDFIRHRRIQLDTIPEALIHATLAAEDKRFWSHGGVDLLATLRSVKDALKYQKFVSGASTITQQTIKLTRQKQPRTLANKISEAFKARKLEMKFSKDEILELYFNTIHYGNRTQGPYQASLHYFNKPLSQLSLAEYALLAGIPQAPTRHNPRNNKEGASKRRNWVLEQMQEEFNYSAEDITRAKSEAIELEPLQIHTSHPQLAEIFSKASTHKKTTIDGLLQKEITRIAKHEIERLKDKNVHNAAVVVIHNPTREILALVGSQDPNHSLGGQYNAALTPRSPGSALKPFVYLQGFEKRGLSPASIIPDITTIYPGERGAEEIVNYDRTHRGPVSIQRALGSSLNIPVVRVLNQTGSPEQLKQYLEKFGFCSFSKTPSEYGLGLAIGAGDVTLLEITNAYATLASLGSYQPATINFRTNSRKAIADPAQCYLIADILTNNQARSDTFGSHSQLRLPFPCAVKTGTSTDYKDNFCVGFTKEFTVGVWVGNIDQTPMREVSGVTGAGPIFHQTMLALHQSKKPTWFTRPSQISLVKIDPHTGKQLQPGHLRYPISEAVSVISPPSHAAPLDYHQGKPILDQRYTQWVSRNHDKFSLPQSDSTFSPHQILQVLSPTKNATYILDPDLHDHGSKLTLKSNLKKTLWSSSTLNIEKGVLTLEEGTHLIKATDPTSDASKMITINVESR